jgi:hypothetical protein
MACNHIHRPARSLPGRLGLAALALLMGVLCAQPSFAQWSAQDGFNADGSPKLAFDLQPYLFLPNTSLTIGLDRAAGEDVTVGRPRPTVASALSSLSAAFDCDCLIRFGNFSGEVNILYVAVKEKTTFPPLPPRLPQAILQTSESVFLISPGIGYRIVNADSHKLSLDGRAGFTYGALTADADFELGEFATAGSKTLSLIQPWVGERLDYYPARKWRLENNFALTGLGVDGGAIGYRGDITAAYLFSHWFYTSLGYAVTFTKRDGDILPNGANREVRLLLYGPVGTLGFRF